MTTILLVEDDCGLVQGLSFALTSSGYSVCAAHTLREAKEKWRDVPCDLVILDIDLPDGSGYDFCRIVRQSAHVPVLFLSAAGEETDMIMGLDIGGDDYMTKPFKLAVFLSRVRALLRRSQSFSAPCTRLRSHDVELDLRSAEVSKHGRKIDLTRNEYRLLRLLMEHAGQTLSSDQILSALWEHEDCYFDTNTTSVYIRRLRLKIEDDPSCPKAIVTIRGLGYQWKEEER